MPGGRSCIPVRPEADPYDLAVNRLARANAFAGEASRRLDRILTSARLRPTAVGLLGQATGADMPLSDHFGVWADVVVLPQTHPR